jgi:hypothetical protein
MQEITARFIRLGSLQQSIRENRNLFIEHDQLLEELLPLFIEVRDNDIIIHREITVGTRRYRLSAGFFDVNRGLRGVQWKSTAFKPFTIETL